MDEQKKQTIDRYLKEVSENLVASRRTKKFFIREFSDLVTSYAGEREDVTIDDLYNEFGKPEVFASQFTDRAEYANLLKKAEKKARLWMILAIGGIVVIAALICFIVYLIKLYGGTITISDAYEPTEITKEIAKTGGKL